MGINTHTESGNILVFILITIVLLGAITAAITRSGGNTNETGSYEQNSINASRLASYAESVKTAVQMLIQRGCSENQISFWHEDTNASGGENTGDDYYNANAPSDNSCHVFQPEGAGLTWISPSSNLTNQDWRIVGTSTIDEVPDPNTSAGGNELVMYLGGLSSDSCTQINLKTGFSISTPPTEDTATFFSTTLYSGTLGTGGTNIDCAEGTGTCTGIQSLCIASDAADAHLQGYVFYHVLIARI